MSHTRIRPYVDDECSAFLQRLQSKGMAASQSQAVRRAVKTAIDHCKENGLDGLAEDFERKFSEPERSTEPESSAEDDADDSGGDVESPQDSGGGGPSDRRTVPNRGDGGGPLPDEHGDDVVTPDRSTSGEDGNQSALSNFNPFN